MEHDDDLELEQIQDWFAVRGFALSILEESDVVWVQLTRPPSDGIVVPRYGRGASIVEAARRAKQRFEEEEEA